MVLVLVVGDALIPERSLGISPHFEKLLAPGRIEHVLVTGDLGHAKELSKLFETLVPAPAKAHIHAARGVFDDVYPTTSDVRAGANTALPHLQQDKHLPSTASSASSISSVSSSSSQHLTQTSPEHQHRSASRGQEDDDRPVAQRERTITSSTMTSIHSHVGFLVENEPVTATDNAPEFARVTIAGLSIGLIHGHQILPNGNQDALHALARKANVDVLISGATHVFEAYEYMQTLFINPGSITGAYTTLTTKEIVPSFVLMDISSTDIIVYVYQLHNDNVKVEKVQFPRRTGRVGDML